MPEEAGQGEQQGAGSAGDAGEGHGEPLGEGHGWVHVGVIMKVRESRGHLR